MNDRGPRPRVAYLCGNLAAERDGVADYTRHLVAALAGTVEPVLVTAGPADSPAPWPEPAHAVTAGRGWGVAGTAAVARALRRLRPDIVHAQFAPSAFGFSPAPGFLPALTGGRARWVTTVHEYGWWAWPAHLPEPARRLGERRRWWDRESGALVPRSRALVVTNDDHAASLRARLGRSAALIPLAPNVDLGPAAGLGPEQAAHRRLRERLGAPPEAAVVVFFGFVHPVKGVRYLLEALATVRRERPETRLVVVGGFASRALPDREAAAFRRELEAWAEALGIAPAVTFTGYRPAAEVSAILAGADVCVLPLTAGVTTKSGALLTALAHGLPTVVTAADPPDPALADGREAVVVRGVRDPAPVAAGLRRVLGDPTLRDRLAAGGREFARRRTWAATAAAHTRLYADVLAGPTSGRPR